MQTFVLLYAAIFLASGHAQRHELLDNELTSSIENESQQREQRQQQQHRQRQDLEWHSNLFRAHKKAAQLQSKFLERSHNAALRPKRQHINIAKAQKQATKTQIQTQSQSQSQTQAQDEQETESQQPTTTGHFLEVDPNVWQQPEIDIQIFNNDNENDDDSELSLLHFEQDPIDQPKPNEFLGKNAANPAETVQLVQTQVAGIVGAAVVTGSVITNNTVYQIRQLPNHKVLVERKDNFDPEYEFEEEDEEDDDIASTLNTTTTGLQFDLGDDDDENERRLQANGDNGDTLDVLVIYTRKAMCAASGEHSTCQQTSNNRATIEGVINLAVSEGNTVLSNSGIPTQLRLVHVHYDSAFDDDAFGWGRMVSLLKGTRDGQLDYVHAMRDQHGADFVSMIVDSKGYCGAGYRSDVPTADKAFSIVRWDCATGHYSFIHEMAHNMGCKHNRLDSQADQSGYNYGHQAKRATRKFRSVMSYNCPEGGCPRVQYFSSNDVTFQGLPVGNYREDNARWIKERLGVYANFKPSVYRRPTLSNNLVPPNTHVAQTNVGNSANSRELVTSSGVYIGSAGNMFDVVAKKDLEITNFAVTSYSSTQVTVEVWQKITTGTFLGRARQTGAWKMIGASTFLAEGGVPTDIPSGTFTPVLVRQGTTQAFYVTFHETTNYNRYHFAGNGRVGEVYTENDDIQFLVGFGNAYKFGRVHFSRIFSGKIYYALTGGNNNNNSNNNAVSQFLQNRNNAPALINTGNNYNKNAQVPARLRGSNTPVVRKHQVMTTFRSGSGQAGNMFTIENIGDTDITIETFDIHIMDRQNQQVLIYTKRGGYEGFEKVDTVWTKICDTTINGEGTREATPIDESEVTSITIKKSHRQSFYITMTSPIMRYTPNALDDNTGDERIKFINSAGAKYPFGKSFPNRLWNGKIYYSTTED